MFIYSENSNRWREMENSIKVLSTSLPSYIDAECWLISITADNKCLFMDAANYKLWNIDLMSDEISQKYMKFNL